MKGLPPGITITEAGDAELAQELFEGFAEAMRNGLMMVYAVLVILFGSFLQPITILFSLPLSIGGAIIALLMTQRPISAPVVIGMLMLMGIVTKNAIMLVDFAIEAMHQGVDRTTAIIDAGQKRARPIIMTTIAMAAGMLPSALAIGAGGEFRSPMAIAVIGGLVVSTLLSLVFVPAVLHHHGRCRAPDLARVRPLRDGERRRDAHAAAGLGAQAAARGVAVGWVSAAAEFEMVSGFVPRLTRHDGVDIGGLRRNRLRAVCRTQGPRYPSYGPAAIPRSLRPAAAPCRAAGCARVSIR